MSGAPLLIDGQWASEVMDECYDVNMLIVGRILSDMQMLDGHMYDQSTCVFVSVSYTKIAITLYVFPI